MGEMIYENESVYGLAAGYAGRLRHAHLDSASLKFHLDDGLQPMPGKRCKPFCEQAPNGLTSFSRRMAYVLQKVHVHFLTVSLVFHIINLRISGNN